MDLEECILVTDITLKKLAINCSDLERLVSENNFNNAVQTHPALYMYMYTL